LFQNIHALVRQKLTRGGSLKDAQFWLRSIKPDPLLSSTYEEFTTNAMAPADLRAGVCAAWVDRLTLAVLILYLNHSYLFMSLGPYNREFLTSFYSLYEN